MEDNQCGISKFSRAVLHEHYTNSIKYELLRSHIQLPHILVPRGVIAAAAAAVDKMSIQRHIETA